MPRLRPQAGETWTHHNGDRYEIVARSLDESTLEPLVTYRSNKNGVTWTRTVADFTQRIESGCHIGTRFTREEG